MKVLFTEIKKVANNVGLGGSHEKFGAYWVWDAYYIYTRVIDSQLYKQLWISDESSNLEL